MAIFSRIKAGRLTATTRRHDPRELPAAQLPPSALLGTPAPPAKPRPYFCLQHLPHRPPHRFLSESRLRSDVTSSGRPSSPYPQPPFFSSQHLLAGAGVIYEGGPSLLSWSVGAARTEACLSCQVSPPRAWPTACLPGDLQ